MSFELCTSCGREYPIGTKLPRSCMCTCELLIKLYELIDYTEHDLTCIRSQCHAGRPTSNGYECMYGNKWYQVKPVDQSPKCECGLDEIVNGVIASTYQGDGK